MEIKKRETPVSRRDYNNVLQNWWFNVPVGKMNTMRSEIISQCHISKYIWFNWMAGRTPVPELAKPIINQIAGENIFNV